MEGTQPPDGAAVYMLMKGCRNRAVITLHCGNKLGANQFIFVILAFKVTGSSCGDTAW